MIYVHKPRRVFNQILFNSFWKSANSFFKSFLPWFGEFLVSSFVKNQLPIKRASFVVRCLWNESVHMIEWKELTNRLWQTYNISLLLLASFLLVYLHLNQGRLHSRSTCLVSQISNKLIAYRYSESVTLLYVDFIVAKDNRRKPNYAKQRLNSFNKSNILFMIFSLNLLNASSLSVYGG